MPLLSHLRARISRPKSKDNKPATRQIESNVNSRNNNDKTAKQSTSAIVKSYLRTGGKNKSANCDEIKGKKSQKLTRSDTFTINEQQMADNYPSSINQHNTNFNTFTRNRVARIKTDVFETFYTKRPSKSSRSSKSSSESRSGIVERYDELYKPQATTSFDSSTYRKPHAKKFELNRISSPVDSAYNAGSCQDKPPVYLFGTIERSTGKRINCDKKVAINAARSSFRNKFLKNDQTEKSVYQPLWFIDVSDQSKDRDQPTSTTTTAATRSLTRKNTFNVDQKPTKYRSESEEKSTQTSIGRKNTFRIDRNSDDMRNHPQVMSTLERLKNFEPIRVEIENIGSDRVGKIRPIGITAPYSALNDVKESLENDHHRSYEKPAAYSSGIKKSSISRQASIETDQSPSITSKDNRSYINIRSSKPAHYGDKNNYKRMIKVSPPADYYRSNRETIKSDWRPVTKSPARPTNVRCKIENKPPNPPTFNWTYNQVHL